MRQQTVRIRNIDFPVAFNCSGTRGFFGDGKEYWYHAFFRFIGLVWLWSTFVAKTTTIHAREGNMPRKKDGYSPADLVPECIHVRQAWRGRLLNAVGLSGPGFDALAATKKWQARREPFFLSFMSVETSRQKRLMEFMAFIERLSEAKPFFKTPFGLQINVSCPNTGHSTADLASEIRDMLDALAAEPSLDDMPALVKGNVFLPTEAAVELDSHPRLDGWVMSNTIHWESLYELSIDRERIFGNEHSPLDRFGGGGYSGPEMRQHVKSWIRIARTCGVKKVIVAENGIRAPWHAVEMIEAGADAIGIGSMAICRPFYVLPTILAAHWAAWRKNLRIAERSVETITIRTPDDFHVHVRAGWMLRLVLKYTTSVFGRFLVMPNKPAVRDHKVLRWLRLKIDRLNRDPMSVPLMTLLIGPKTRPVDVTQTGHAGAIACKLYPDGVTTGSEGGVRNFRALRPIYERISQTKVRPLPHMRPTRMALCLHGEMPGEYCITREISFLTEVDRILRDHPGMPVVLEHITTKEAAEFVWRRYMDGHKIAATITAHHLKRTLNDVIGSKVRVHEHCQPCPKGPEDREALINAATSGLPCFFFGSDSAPHAQNDKECAEGCAGAFTAPVALPTLVEVFEAKGRLDKLEDFVSVFGARFYGLPLNIGTVSLAKKPWKVPKRIGFSRWCVIPWRAGETMTWKIVAKKAA